MTPSVRTLQGSKQKGFRGSTPLCPRGSNTRGFSNAIDQIKATIDKPIFQHKSIGHRWARIVAQSVPSNTGKSVVERARNYFSKKHITFKCKSGVLEEVVE